MTWAERWRTIAGARGDEGLLLYRVLGRHSSVCRENPRNRTDTSGGFSREILIETDEISEIERFCVLVDGFVLFGGDFSAGIGGKNCLLEFVDFPLIAKRPRWGHSDFGVEVEKGVEAALELGLYLLTRAFDGVHGDVGLVPVG
jgi:hypothetical protein